MDSTTSNFFSLYIDFSCKLLLLNKPLNGSSSSLSVEQIFLNSNSYIMNIFNLIFNLIFIFIRYLFSKINKFASLEIKAKILLLLMSTLVCSLSL